MESEMSASEQAGCCLRTDEGAAIPLRGVEVTGELLGGHARVVVRQRYQNTERRPVEAIYVFPLPADATLTSFVMEVAGRRMEGVVKEREEAFKAYDDALTAGHGAAMLEQERPNVFTASVGNLLPGEETLIEVEYLQKLGCDEGALRWMIPTLVAPRYIPGAPAGDRTGHGAADPTSVVPDADRITPRIGDVAYGLKLDLMLDLGRELEVESPSHALQFTREPGSLRTRVSFAQREVALDRDVVIIARGAGLLADDRFTALAVHRPAGQTGTFALTVVPDLLADARNVTHQEVVFLIDISGSMGGESLPQAVAALRLCLRHLREGDRFNVLAFDDRIERFQPRPVPFTQATLEQADAWASRLAARGGTELLAPLLEAVRQTDGVIVLLTDGQVGNEAQIERDVMAARKAARIYSFGIGTNVSDALLRGLGRHTGGAVEFIHPGERIDDKVIAQFARAIAPRVTELSVKWDGVEVGEVCPGELPALIDGEPWTVYGRIEPTSMPSGRVEVRGKLDGKSWGLTLPVAWGEGVSRPALPKLWAAERIRDLEAMAVTGRREGRMKERIIALAVEHGVSSQHTAFVVVETRTGDRRVTGPVETRAVPVNAPAGWDMFGTVHEKKEEAKRKRSTMTGMTRAGSLSSNLPYPAAPPPPSGAPMPMTMGAPPRPSAPAPARPMESRLSGGHGMGAGAGAPGGPPDAKPGLLGRMADKLGLKGKRGSAQGEAERSTPRKTMMREARDEAPIDSDDAFAPMQSAAFAPEAEEATFDLPARKADDGRAVGGDDPVAALLGRQLASGLWAPAGGAATADDRAKLQATANALLVLLRAGVTATHRLYGAQVKKAVSALIPLALKVGARDAGAAELALGVAWLAASGRRSRSELEQAMATLKASALSALVGDEPAMRAHVDKLARA
ncbi:MAG: VWA domain-containing protein [Deltaproteobacteria bacterium]|nr:VWA domain-containing protein [Deltaproteobacteria bacterium]